jgi:hypothetical protein
MSTLLTSNEGTFKTHDAGNFMAVCVDVYTKVEPNRFKGNQRDDGSFDQRDTVNNAYIVFRTSQGQDIRYKCTATLGGVERPSNLRKFLKAWDPKITDAQLQQFDLDTMIGKAAWLTVAHRESGGKTYANVLGAMTPPPGNPVPTIPASYVRYKDRTVVEATPSPTPAQSTGDVDDLPF